MTAQAHKSTRASGADKRTKDKLPSIAERLFAAGDVDMSLSLAAITVGAAAMAFAAGVEPSQASDLAGYPMLHPVAADVSQIAAQEDFWVNILRYFQFFISLMTGTAYVILKPFAGLLKRPVTAVLLVVGVVGFIFFLRFTIDAMLGLTDPIDYQFAAIQ